MGNENEIAKHDAARRWLFDQVGVRGKYASLEGLTYGPSRMRRGVWYPIRSHDANAMTLSLDIDGTDETVPIQYLAVQAVLPQKTTVYKEGKWNDHPGDMVCVGVCPHGHEHELGPGPPAAGFCHCPECNLDYQWVWEGGSY